MLCDGRIVCGCADPYGKRVLGDARHSSVQEVWTGSVVTALRTDLNAGGSKFCGDCPLKLPLKKDEAPPQRNADAGPLPSRMYIECTAACNISCTEACCAPETGITRTRQAGMLDFDLFRRVVDEAGPSLVRIDFTHPLAALPTGFVVQEPARKTSWASVCSSACSSPLPWEYSSSQAISLLSLAWEVVGAKRHPHRHQYRLRPMREVNTNETRSSISIVCLHVSHLRLLPEIPTTKGANANRVSRRHRNSARSPITGGREVV